MKQDSDSAQRGSSLVRVVDQRWPPAAWLLLTAIVVGVAILSALSLHHSCVHPPPPVSVPDPGTPRAEFCEAADTAVPWLQVSLSVFAYALVVVTSRMRPTWSFAAAILVCGVNVLLALLAGSLDAARTI